jgi:hypothetical protein
VEFVDVIAAGAGDPIDDDGNWMPGPNGGIFGTSTRGINAGGLEVRQIVDKGVFAGGGLFNYALSLTEGTIDEATIDSIAAAWGSNDALDRTGSLTDSANYSNQMGFFGAMATALTQAKALASDEACTAERDAALRTFFHTWEQSMVARTVYYVNVALDAATTGTSDDDIIGGLHELGEGTGLTLGFRGIADPTSGPLAGDAVTITDAQVGQIMDALGINTNDLNASTTGEFIEDPSAFAAAVLAAEAVVAEAYGLTAEQVAAYRTPTAG